MSMRHTKSSTEVAAASLSFSQIRNLTNLQRKKLAKSQLFQNIVNESCGWRAFYGVQPL